MPKRVFWPIALLAMGFVLMAALMGYLPPELMMFWPVVLIIVGLGGLLTSDREDWLVLTSRQTTKSSAAAASKKTSKSAAKAKTSRRK